MPSHEFTWNYIEALVDWNPCYLNTIGALSYKRSARVALGKVLARNVVDLIVATPSWLRQHTSALHWVAVLAIVTCMHTLVTAIQAAWE
jgi:hypothetical protein